MTQIYNEAFVNATPVVQYKGIKDNSTRPIPFTEALLPIHIPHFFVYGNKGPIIAEFGTPAHHGEMFGEEIFNVNGKYGTLATPYINLMSKYGNPMVIQRIIPEDAKPEATLCLALEVIKTDKLRRIARREDGHRRYDANNHEVYDGTTIAGHIARWRIINTNNASLGQQDVKVGNGKFQYKHDAAANSTIYPILEFKAQWIGSYANNVGIRLWAPTVRDTKPLPMPVVNDQLAMLYRMQIVVREDARSQPNIVKTNNGEDYVQFAFRPNTYDNINLMGLSVNFEETFLDNYQDMDTRGGKSPKYGDIGEVYVYHENIETLLSDFFAAEKLVNSQFDEIDVEEGKHLFNFVSGNDADGRAYHSFHLLNELTGAETAMTINNTHYLQGGFDGTMGNVAYDKAVRHQFKFFGQLENKYRDMAYFPCHQFYDPGYSSETKLAMFNVIKIRPDTNITLSTCDFVNNQNKAPDAAEASSRGFALTMAARRHPESVEFGTSVCRVAVIPEAMQLINDPTYRKWVPTTYEIARMRAQYMSKPDGLAQGQGYDAPPYNFVQEGKNVTNMSQAYSKYVTDWENGMSYWGYVNRGTVFSPIVRTVYNNDTSVLMSDITMQCLCDMTYQAHGVWAALSGNSKMPDEVFLNESNNLFNRRIIGRYDNRFNITPNSFKTEADKARGYSWTMEVAVEADNARTVLTMYPIVDRRGG